jgi:hypothetical protein
VIAGLLVGVRSRSVLGWALCANASGFGLLLGLSSGCGGGLSNPKFGLCSSLRRCPWVPPQAFRLVSSSH